MKDLEALFYFILRRKQYWLAPTIFFMLLLSAIILALGSSYISPFIYSLF
ncbi:DUF5989 family protein [Cytophaga sp. FL35]